MRVKLVCRDDVRYAWYAEVLEAPVLELLLPAIREFSLFQRRVWKGEQSCRWFRRTGSIGCCGRRSNGRGVDIVPEAVCTVLAGSERYAIYTFEALFETSSTTGPCLGASDPCLVARITGCTILQCLSGAISRPGGNIGQF